MEPKSFINTDCPLYLGCSIETDSPVDLCTGLSCDGHLVVASWVKKRFLMLDGCHNARRGEGWWGYSVDNNYNNAFHHVTASYWSLLPLLLTCNMHYTNTLYISKMYCSTALVFKFLFSTLFPVA